MKLTWNPPPIKSISATYSWGGGKVDYAEDVYFGPERVGLGRGVARPWADVAIARNDLSKILIDYYAFLGDLTAAFLELAEYLGEEFKDVIDNHDWGVVGNAEKLVRGGPTYQTITDSGDLRDSQRMEVNS